MANSRSHDARPIQSISCKCSKSDLKMKKPGAPYLESAVSKIEERRSDLANRQNHLREKITAMERSIPALMAFNMWKSAPQCTDAPLCKIKQIMSKVSSQPDPTERLLDSLKNTVKSLNTETAELHDKIIAADIKLEESSMELESLELANREYEGTLRSLEKELNKQSSLHSIHSADLFCLTRIRQLGEEEVNLKHSIKELEERETLFQEQMNRVLTSREFQKALCENQVNEKKIRPCPMHAQTQSLQQTKKKLMRNGKERPTTNNDEKDPSENPVAIAPESRSPDDVKHGNLDFATTESRVPEGRENGGAEESLICRPCAATKASCDKFSCPSRTSTSGKLMRSSRKKSPSEKIHVCPNRVKNQQSVKLRGCSPKSCRSSLTTKSNASRGHGCSICWKNSSNPLKSKCKRVNPSMAIKSKCCKDKSSCWLSAIAKCPASTTCGKCQGLIPCRERPELRETSRCRCSCKGKCAMDNSDVPCNCADWLDSPDEEGHKPIADSRKIEDQSSTDEEFSECCDCGCNDSDFSDSCLF